MKVAVLGGGVTGLACALRLQELAREKSLPLEIGLFEASDRLGSSVETVREQGVVIEMGPDAIFTEKPWGLDFLKKLGLENEIMGTDPRYRKSFVAWRGKLIPVPEGFYLLAPSNILSFGLSPLFSLWGKLRALADLLIPARELDTDESLASFVRRRLGREVLERAAQPLAGGIYGADMETLSVKATFPRFLEMERKHGSILRGLAMGNSFRKSKEARGPRYSLFVTLRGGMDRMIEAAGARIPASSIHLGAAVDSVRRDSNGGFVLSVNGTETRADAVCSCLTAWRAASIFSGLDPALSEDLGRIPYGSVGTVNLLYDKLDVKHPLDGFGFVVPDVERRSIIGCSFSSVKFPGRAPEGKVLLRAYLGGDFAEKTLQEPDEKILDLVFKDLNELLGIRAKPLLVIIRKHVSTMPQYQVGHLDLVESIERRAGQNAGIFFAGNAFNGVGIPDCVRSGERAAERAVRHLQPSPKF